MNFKCLKDHIKMTPLYKSTNISKINDIYKLKVAKFVHFLTKKLSKNFKMSFKPTYQFLSCQTRLVTNENLERMTLHHAKSSYFIKEVKF